MDPLSPLAPWYLKLAFLGARTRTLAGALFIVAFVGSFFVEGKLPDVIALLSLLAVVVLTPARWVLRLNDQARLVRG